MNVRLTHPLTIDMSHLLQMDLSKWTLVPFLMIFSVIVNMSMNLTIMELQLLSYAVLAAALLSFLVMAVFYFRRRIISQYVAIIILFQLLLFTSTVINGNEVKECIYQNCTVIFIAMAADYFKDRFHFLIGAVALSFSFCAYLAFLHLMTHPELWIVEDAKVNQGYLLGGNYNQMGGRLLCAIGTSVVCLKYSKWWLLNIIPVVLLSMVPLVIVKSMTSIAGIMLFLVFCFISSRKILKTSIVALIATVILFQIFVCFQGKGIEHNSLAVWMVEDVLGKDITFTNRTYLWDAASKIVTDSPLYGYGLVEGDWYYSHMSSLAKGPHNFIWGILIYGGILLLVVFTFICYMVFVKLFHLNDRYVLLLYAIAASMFLMMLMEVYPPPLILTVLTLAFFAPRKEVRLKR